MHILNSTINLLKPIRNIAIIICQYVLFLDLVYHLSFLRNLTKYRQQWERGSHGLECNKDIS